MPIQMDLKEKKNSQEQIWTKGICFKFFFYLFIYFQLMLSFSLGFNQPQTMMPLGTEGRGRRRRHGQGLEMQKHLKLLVYFFIYCTNICFQMNRLQVWLSPL